MTSGGELASLQLWSLKGSVVTCSVSRAALPPNTEGMKRAGSIKTLGKKGSLTLLQTSWMTSGKQMNLSSSIPSSLAYPSM